MIMSPEGLSLLKKTVFGLLFVFVLAYVYLEFVVGTPQTTTQSHESSKNKIRELGLSKNIEKLLSQAPERIERSAKKGLVQQLHKHAYNYYRSNRVRNAIAAWDTAHFLAPDDALITLRLNEARSMLEQLVDENIALGRVDLEYQRYDRSLHFFRRAANLVSGLDPKRYDEIQILIKTAERQLNR